MPDSSIPESSARSAVFRRSFTKPSPAAVRGEGVHVWDSEGKRYLDFSGSAAVNFVGHGVAEISAAMAEQAAKLEFVHTSQFTTPAAEEYAQELLEFAGENFRYKIVSRQQSYHGSTLGALAVSGNKRRREMYLPMVREFEHIGFPYCYRCAHDCKDGCRNCGQQYAEELERAIKATNSEVAAFILEPVSGATLGAALPPQDYLQAVAEICHRNGVLLIVDEVMTGMGRTGRNFSVEHWGVAPDILVAAKGLSSGYAPLGAVIASKKIRDAIAAGSGSFVHGLTFNAHPISMAAGRAVLRLIQSGKLVQAADSDQPGSMGEKLRLGLDSLRDLPSIGDVRGIGLLWGVEFVADKRSKQPFLPELNFAARVAQAALKRGLLVYPVQGCVDGSSGDHVLIAPPAVITAEQIAWSVDQLKLAVQESASQ